MIPVLIWMALIGVVAVIPILILPVLVGVIVMIPIPILVVVMAAIPALSSLRMVITPTMSRS
jgi:hypothetical protein